jgi:hypothetical protein
VQIRQRSTRNKSIFASFSENKRRIFLPQKHQPERPATQ